MFNSKPVINHDDAAIAFVAKTWKYTHDSTAPEFSRIIISYLAEGGSTDFAVHMRSVGRELALARLAIGFAPSFRLLGADTARRMLFWVRCHIEANIEEPNATSMSDETRFALERFMQYLKRVVVNVPDEHPVERFNDITIDVLRRLIGPHLQFLATDIGGDRVVRPDLVMQITDLLMTNLEYWKRMTDAYKIKVPFGNRFTSDDW